MFISGMCFEHVEADSLFVYAALEYENHTTVLTSAKEMPPLQTICINEIAGTQRIECQEVQSRGNQNRSAVRAGTALSFLEVLPQNPILTRAMMIGAADNERSGREVIIAYIHHQDGEKDSI